MHVHWTLDDRHRWDAFTDGGLAGLQQSWAYGDAMQALGVPCLRVAVTQDRSPKSPWLGAAQFIVQRLPWFVRFTFCQGGPLWASDAPLALQCEAVDVIRHTLPLGKPRMALFSPAEDVSTDKHALSHRVRLASGRSTVLLDLTRPEAERRAALEQRWRNRLHAAERSLLKVRVCGSKTSDYEWLVQAEASQRKTRGYLSLPMGFVPAFQNAHRKPSQALLTLAAELQNQRCAGMMFLVHGSTATYHLGWSDETGREHSAHNRLLWQACTLLAERGVRQLDLGGVNTLSNPGLARFKLGSGGRVVTWAGTYV
ncbi:MAG: GNAT family N-acetyltransferase [Betaproteobacteria bacterium]|nr:GNAT family N-acetyltransferase [Betaproteobacteria bacterium]NBU50551.1 GNAT family N-acetyltransferase [Betaproteobacteria bacterium]